MNVVIYARFSSHSQTEQSIEGQLKVCYEYAEQNHYTVVGEYIDRARRLNFNAALDRIGKYDRKNCALVAALYLLTADFQLWNQTRRYVENHGISFGKLRPKNCSEHSYPLYCAAKDLYLGTKHITINNLADNKLINAKTFALICNAMAIRKFGLGAIQLTDEPKT